MERLLVAIVIACVPCIFAKPPSAIKGGDAADTGEFPWQVSLRMDYTHVCGGSIIDDRHILTAAHCVQEEDGRLFKGMRVLIGSNNARQWFPKTHKVKSLHPHKKYRQVEPYRYDIAIVTLEEPIEFNDRQKPIALPEKDVSIGDEVTVSGWGHTNWPAAMKTYPVTLMKMEKKIVSNSRCMRDHQSVIYRDQLCAYGGYGKGVCSGDSGSGLIYNGQIVGIASWVMPCAVGYPDVYTRVYSHKDWIARIIVDN
ncbi:chymotrypsin-1-like [Diachasma alloeum]|uniref:chymotrypsin-1-like n=1 Tax=Diachasma alloeum TaxID=454923 RepID=UPI0007381938|nr:chymotrypsin-1-like [Diachasma alloeum]